MKKGDIVQLKGPQTLPNAALWHSGLRAIESMDSSKFPTTFTVARVWNEPVCCSFVRAMSFDEFPDIAFTPDQFEVVLESGEPDVEQLMKESAEVKVMMSMGM